MSYEEAKRVHDEQMARVRAALDGDDPRAAAIAELRTQLTNVTAERDALRAQLAAATKPPSTGVWMHTDKYHELLASIDRYGADQWRRGAGNKDLQEFAEWQREI